MDKGITLLAEDNEEVRLLLQSNNTLSIKITKPGGNFYTVYIDAKSLHDYLSKCIEEETISNSGI